MAIRHRLPVCGCGAAGASVERAAVGSVYCNLTAPLAAAGALGASPEAKGQSTRSRVVIAVMPGLYQQRARVFSEWPFWASFPLALDHY
jgi:hypothetical protein